MSQQEILDALKLKPMGLHEVHIAIGRAQAQTSRALKKLVVLGEIVKGEDKKYRLVEK